MCGVRKLTHTAYANRSTEAIETEGRNSRSEANGLPKLRRGPSSEARTAKRRPSGCAYDACSETSPKIMTKWSTMIALRGQSTDIRRAKLADEVGR